MTTQIRSNVDYFASRYLGPRGAHLDHRTHYTQTGQMPGLETAQSIHPRVAFGRQLFPKVNTAKEKKK